MNKHYISLIISMVLFIIYLIPIIQSFSVPDDVQELLKDSEGNGDIQDTTEQAKYAKENDRTASEANPNVAVQAPIQINKEILPGDNSSFLTNNVLKVRVDAQLTGKELRNIQILESMDQELGAFNISPCYIINNLRDIPNIEKSFNNPTDLEKYTKNIPKIIIYNKGKDNSQISDEFDNDSSNIVKDNGNLNSNAFSLLNENMNSTFMIEKNNILDSEKVVGDNIGKKGRLIYWYYIKPTKPGIYKIKTIIRTNDIYPDLEESIKVDINEPNPRFIVDVTGQKLEVECGEMLNLTYNVRYIGGSTDPFLCDLKINNTPKDYEIINEKTTYLDEYFRNNELKQIYVLVKYKDPGRYYLPDLLIIGKDEPGKQKKYMFKKETVTVIDLMQKNRDLISWTILAAGIIIGQIYGQDINRFSKYVYSLLKRIKIFNPVFIRFKSHILKPFLNYLKKLVKYEDEAEVSYFR